jgi:hypothetical protein
MCAIQRCYSATNYITMHRREGHLCGPGKEVPRVPPSRIHLAREEVEEGERRDRTEPPVQRRQDEELHPDNRLRVEDVDGSIYLSICTMFRNVRVLINDRNVISLMTD